MTTSKKSIGRLAESQICCLGFGKHCKETKCQFARPIVFGLWALLGQDTDLGELIGTAGIT